MGTLQLCQSPPDVFEPDAHHDNHFITYGWFVQSTTDGNSAALSVTTRCFELEAHHVNHFITYI